MSLLPSTSRIRAPGGFYSLGGAGAKRREELGSLSQHMKVAPGGGAPSLGMNPPGGSSKPLVPVRSDGSVLNLFSRWMGIPQRWTPAVGEPLTFVSWEPSSAVSTAGAAAMFIVRPKHVSRAEAESRGGRANWESRELCGEAKDDSAGTTSSPPAGCHYSRLTGVLIQSAGGCGRPSSRLGARHQPREGSELQAAVVRLSEQRPAAPCPCGRVTSGDGAQQEEGTWALWAPFLSGAEGLGRIPGETFLPSSQLDGWFR